MDARTMTKKKIKKVKVPTVLVKYPCPKCGNYYLPEYHQKDGKAVMVCLTHGIFKTSVAVSLNFRKFCSKIGSKPHRSPVYYSSSEKKVQRYLERRNLIEGIEYFHNSRIKCKIKGRVRYFWLDFIIPKLDLVIEASPRIWHKLWNRAEADARKRTLLKAMGLNLIELDEKDLRRLNKRRKKSKYPRPENCKKLDKIFGCENQYES